MKYCPYCGAGLQDEMRFCPKCGQRHQDATAGVEAVHEESPYVEEATKEEKSYVAVELKKPEVRVYETKRKSKVPIIIVGLLMVVIAGVAYLLASNGNKESDTNRVAAAANSVLYLEVFDDKKELVGTASGFVIEDGTTLITNYHVVEDACHIVAWTPDGENSVKVSDIIAYDKDADLAVLQCDSNIGVQPLVLGDSEAIKQGDAVYAVGYPLGLAHTLSDGVVSSRYVDELGIEVLQITAAISSGSSGGALLEETGQVVGVICASYSEGQNLNLAIPTYYVVELLNNATADMRMPLDEYYSDNHKDQELTVDYVLTHYDELDSEWFYLDAWVSSCIVDKAIIKLYCVGNPTEVYSSKINSDEHLFEEIERYQNYRSILIMNFGSYNENLVRPGNHIRLFGCITSTTEGIRFDYTRIQQA